MSEGRIRHMFPGGNTPAGFFSYYEYVISPYEARKIFILKGGPGTGKSTLMKKVGLEFSKKGYDVEFMRCSSDNNSLDGVVIPKLKIAILDGTAPHVIDPVFPGAVDEIINLGQFWNEKGFENYKEQILAINQQIKGHFARAYRYLKAAAYIKNDTENIYENAMNKGRAILFACKLASEIFRNIQPSDSFGKLRRMFASGITPGGFTDNLDSLCSGTTIIRLIAPTGSNTGEIMEHLKKEALLRGFYTEAFYCPMDPVRVEHLIIPELNVSVITANVYHDISDPGGNNCVSYDLREFHDQSRIGESSDELEFNCTNAEVLMQQAIKCIGKAKKAHDELERYYIKNMDFAGLNKLQEELVEKILNYA